MKITGYRRRDGRMGIRNHLLILSTVVCANEVAQRVQRRVRGTVIAVHPHGCCMMGADLEQFKRTLINFASNPNVGAVLAIGLGCEQVDARWLAGEIVKRGPLAADVSIQPCGGTMKAVARGIELATRLQKAIAGEKRRPVDLNELIVALQCGGSDFSSGLAANPAMGYASDRLVNLGGTVVLSETTEIIGGEHLLAKRAVTKETARRIHEVVKRIEDNAARLGVDIRGSQPTPGNIRGGITTIEEKSLGCIYKAGQAPLQGVVEYAEPILGKGLWFMDTPGQDAESVTGMAAGGMHLMTFSTGLGTPMGCAVMPVIKMTGNPQTARAMKDNIDLNLGTIFEGKETIESAGRRVFDEIIAVANGKLTKAERRGHYEFGIYRIGPTI